MTVLDASALLAFLVGEPGAERVQSALPTASVSLVNLTEAVSVLSRKGMPIGEAEDAVTSMRLPTLAPTEATALVAARLSAHRELSLGDRYCIAEAMAQTANVLTADRVWAQLNLPVTVELIR